MHPRNHVTPQENPATWQLWLQYPNDFKAPIQAKNKEDMVLS